MWWLYSGANNWSQDFWLQSLDSTALMNHRGLAGVFFFTTIWTFCSICLTWKNILRIVFLWNRKYNLEQFVFIWEKLFCGRVHYFEKYIEYCCNHAKQTEHLCKLRGKWLCYILMKYTKINCLHACIKFIIKIKKKKRIADRIFWRGKCHPNPPTSDLGEV